MDHMDKDSFRKLDDLYNYNNELNLFSRLDEDIVGEINEYDQYKDSNFFLLLDENGLILEIFDESNGSSNYNLDEVLKSVNQTSKLSGKISDYKLSYKWYGENLIGFIDYTNEQNFMNKQIREYVSIILISIIIFLLISIYISYLIVKPIESMWEKKQQFIMDASHELKTPITVMRANAAVLMEELEDEKKEWLSNIDGEAEYIQKLIEDLLFLTKLDDVKNQDSLNQLNISNIVYETGMSFEPLLFDEGLKLNIDIEENLYIKGIDSYIRRLLVIFLDNARKYSNEKTIINLSLKTINNKVTLSINNQGDIIQTENLKKIFDRFYMIEKSRKRNSHGLGLSLAKEIADIHHAKILVESNIEDGTTFTTVFNS
jgi:signal transduction histidine kinase